MRPFYPSQRGKGSERLLSAALTALVTAGVASVVVLRMINRPSGQVTVGVALHREPKNRKELELVALLNSLFATKQLRHWIRTGPMGVPIVHALPDTAESPSEYAWEAVEESERHGVINGDWFDRLVKVRPLREDDIRRVQSLWMLESAIDGLRMGR